MNFRDVNSLIDEGEGFTIEFKRRISSPEKIARTLISFANTRGGTILFGVDDDGSIVGVESEKSEIEMIGIAGKDFCDPPVETAIDIVAFDGLDVIVCTVSESRTKPHYYLGDRDHLNGESTRVYIRVNDKTMMASREVVKILRDERPDEPPLTAVNEAELPQFDNDAETGLASTTLDGNGSVIDTCVSAISRSLFLIRIAN